jgi:hypothetical protein
MNNYKLYIKGLDAVWRIADLGDNVPAMNYQVNDIAELKDRQANYSQNLKLPPTDNNCKIFGYSNNFDVSSLVPYRRLECRLFSNDVIIAGYGSYIVLDKVTDTFEVQILSGIAYFFQNISTKEIKDLDLGRLSWNIDFYKTQLEDIVNSPTFAYAEFSKEIGVRHTTSGYFKMMRALPFISLKGLVHKIIETNGYTIDEYVEDAENTSIMIVPKVGDALSYSNMETVTNEISYDATVEGGAQYTLSNYSLGNIIFASQKDGVLTLKFNSNFRLTFSLLIAITVKSGNGSSYNVIKSIDGVETVHQGYPVGYYNIIYEDWEVEKGKEVQISVRIANYTLSTTLFNIKTHIEISNVESISTETNEMPIGGSIPVSLNIPYKNQSDIFKLFCQLNELTVFVDEENKVVYCRSFSDMINYKAYAKDWSKKLHKDGLEYSYSDSKYGYNTIIKLKDDTEIGITQKTVLPTDNETLQKEKNLFELDLMSAFEDNVLHLRAIEVDENGNIEVSPIGNYLANVEAQPSLDIEIVNNTENRQPERVMMKRASLFSEYQIYNNYAGLRKIISNYRTIEAKFNLTDQDIEDYLKVDNNIPGCFIPVWIDYFGAYFYINKIKNFISGKLTTVELIKL